MKTFQTIVSIKNLFSYIILCFFLISQQQSIQAQSIPTNLPWSPDPKCKGILTKGIAVATCAVSNNFPVADRYTMGMINIQNSVANAVSSRTVVSAQMYHHPSWHIDSIGNVFGVAIDGEGHSYVTASANYPSSFFVSGTAILKYGNLGGGADDLAAAGTIYKIDKITGQASVFQQLPQQAFNFTHSGCYSSITKTRTTGPGLGNISYDKAHNQLFVSNFEDGKIYRLDILGNIIDSYDPDINDTGAVGLPPDEVPFGLSINEDGTKLFYGTLFNSGKIKSIDLNPLDGSFVGSVLSSSPYPTIIGTEVFHTDLVALNPFSSLNSVSDLSFLPNGNLMVGERKSYTANFANACNHQTSSYELSQSGSLFNVPTNIEASYDAVTQFNDDQYGGIAYYVNASNNIEYVLSSSDLLNNSGPHGIAVIPRSSTGSPRNVMAVIPYSPLTVSNDVKGVGGDVEVFNECDCIIEEPSFCTYSCTSNPYTAIDNDDVGYDQYLETDGTKILVGVSHDLVDRLYVQKVDNCGNVLESWIYSPNLDYTNIGKVKITKDVTNNKYVLAIEFQISSGQTDVHLMTIDATAFNINTLTASVIDSPVNYETVEQIIVDSENSYVIAMNQRDPSGNHSVIVLKYSSSLNSSWIRRLSIPAYSDMKAFDLMESTQILGAFNNFRTSYLLVGSIDQDAFIIGLDWYLTPSKTNLIDIDNNNATAENIRRIVYNGTDFIVAGNHLDPPTNDHKVWTSNLTINNNYIASNNWLNILDENGTKNETLIDLALDPDGFLLTGQIEISQIGLVTGSTLNDIAYVGRFDFAGVQTWARKYEAKGTKLHSLKVNTIGIHGQGVLQNCYPDPSPPGYVCSSDLFRLQLNGDGILEDSTCMVDFNFSNTDWTPLYLIDTSSYTQLPNNIFTVTNKPDHAPYDKSCCFEELDACNVELDVNTINTDSCCVVSLDLINYNTSIYSIKIEIQTAGIFFDQIMIDPSLQYAASPIANPTTIYIDNLPSHLPIGTLHDFINFCYGSTSSSNVLSQRLRISYFDVSGIELHDCCSYIDTSCDVPTTDDDCLDIIPISLDCYENVDHKFTFCFQVKNNTNPAQVLDAVRLDIADPNVNIIPTVHNLVPPINSGILSSIQCVDIYASPLISYPYAFQLTTAAKDTSGTFCCNDSETINLVLPNCCDPCIDEWVRFSNTQPNDDCCYKFDFKNDCDNTLSKIVCTLAPTGADFGTTAIDPSHAANWFINPLSPQKIELVPNTTPVSRALYQDLLHMCVNNRSNTNNPVIVFEYMMKDVNGADSLACIEKIQLSCDNEQPCLEVVRDSVFCDDSGNYFLDFCVKNTSNSPSFTIGQIDINNLLTPLYVTPTTYTGLSISPGGTYCNVVPIYSTTGTPAPGDMLNLSIESHSSGLDTCCVDGAALGTILLPCEDCDDVIIIGDDDLSDKVYHANEEIRSEVTIRENTSIEYLSGNTIELQPGFSTELNSQFTADTEACQTTQNALWNCDTDCPITFENLPCGQIRIKWGNCAYESYRFRIFFREGTSGPGQRQTFNNTYSGSYDIPGVVPGNTYQITIYEKRKWSCSWNLRAYLVTLTARICQNTSSFEINNSNAGEVEVCGFEPIILDASNSVNTHAYEICMQEIDQFGSGFGPTICHNANGRAPSSFDLKSFANGNSWNLIGGRRYKVTLTTYNPSLGVNPVSSFKFFKMKEAFAQIHPVEISTDVLPCLAVTFNTQIREYLYGCNPIDLAYVTTGTSCDQGYFVEIAEVQPNVSGGFDNIPGTVYSDWVDLNNSVPSTLDIQNIYITNGFPAFQQNTSYRIKLAVRFPWHSDEFIIHF